MAAKRIANMSDVNKWYGDFPSQSIGTGINNMVVSHTNSYKIHKQDLYTSKRYKVSYSKQIPNLSFRLV